MKRPATAVCGPPMRAVGSARFTASAAWSYILKYSRFVSGAIR